MAEKLYKGELKLAGSKKDTYIGTKEELLDCYRAVAVFKDGISDEEKEQVVLDLFEKNAKEL